MSEPGGVNGYDMHSSVPEEKQAHDAVPPWFVHLFISRGGRPVVKASMTKDTNASKHQGISTPWGENAAIFLAFKIFAKPKSATNSYNSL